jgi:hypothetical protein
VVRFFRSAIFWQGELIVFKSDYKSLLRNIKSYLDKHPENGNRLFKAVEEMVEAPVSTGTSCPFCDSEQFRYKSGKVVCDCPESVQTRTNPGWK